MDCLTPNRYAEYLTTGINVPETSNGGLMGRLCYMRIDPKVNLSVPQKVLPFETRLTSNNEQWHRERI
jgi:hypothetical protein